MREELVLVVKALGCCYKWECDSERNSGRRWEEETELSHEHMMMPYCSAYFLAIATFIHCSLLLWLAFFLDFFNYAPVVGTGRLGKALFFSPSKQTLYDGSNDDVDDDNQRDHHTVLRQEALNPIACVCEWRRNGTSRGYFLLLLLK